jgi:RNA polymerase sigma-70 factor (ECF subfamily)
MRQPNSLGGSVWNSFMAAQARSSSAYGEVGLRGESQSAVQVDQELVQRVKQGDKKAFDLLVLKYQPKIIQLIARYIKDPSEALDVAQEAFIKAYRALPNFRGESAFYTWLYRIAINTAKNHIAARARRPSDSEIELETAEQFETAIRLKDQETPEGILLSEEVAEAVRQAIEELPEELRTAITLREFEGLSYEEIAETMNCPVGTVRSRIFRAREAIDKKLRTLYAGMRSKKAKKPEPSAQE